MGKQVQPGQQVGGVIPGPAHGAETVAVELFPERLQRGNRLLRPLVVTIGQRQLQTVEVAVRVTQQMGFHRCDSFGNGGMPALVDDAYIAAAFAVQLRTAVAGQKIGSSSTNQTTTIARNYNGIVAINGDYFTKTKAGYIVRMGETYREKTSANMDLLLIDELGDFHICLHGHDVQENSIAAFKSEHEIINGFFFGPALVVDGEVQEIPENYQFDPHQKNPRAGIAQLGTLTYALVAVNGRTDQSAGVTLAEFADIMGQLGAKQAYNLDGGNSATLAFNGEVYNDKPQAERAVTDIIYFASATAGE